MKTKISNEALGFIAVAASNVATKLAKTPTTAAIINPNEIKLIAKPQLTRRLREHLDAATTATDTDTTVDFLATRHLEGPATTCDASFLKCILSPTCRMCFQTLQENDIDWANVVPDTPCQDVIGFLVSGGHCLDVKNGGTDDQDTFCSAFDACVVWDEEDDVVAKKDGIAGAAGDDSTGATEEMKIDCAALTECAWDGMHEHFLGDGVCHDAMPGCYNSKACNYDGGDCCEDTCHYPGQTAGGTGGDSYGECGQEGYACRDPSSMNCQPVLARDYKEFCANESEEEAEGISVAFDDDMFKDDEILPECGSSDLLYRLIQFDSWGDGWDATILTLTEQGNDAPIYQGGLTYGSQGTVHVCLTKKDPKCYHVTVENGVWGNEISWELRPLAGGAPILAAGGSPSDCTVALAGTVDACPNTCDSTRPDTKIEDPNYMSYKTMQACIEKKCIIQVGNCAQDESCSECMQESTPEYCFANENFNVLIDCSMCSCTEDRPAYCDAKSSGAVAASGSSAATHEGNSKPDASGATFGSATGGTNICGPEQTLKGTTSLIKFSQCADMDKMMAMVTDFDNDNFGMLDLFEECAHTYDEEPMHGGKLAMDCMKILDNIVWGDDDRDSNDDKIFKNAKGEVLPENIGQAIGTLAHHLYHDPETFCECAAYVNRETPMCSSFINFKTLLFEAIDVCKSLDAIDCAAWEEFHTPCKKNLIQMFDSVDFSNGEQCDYVENMCGGAGPFPAFRKLDCGGEIAKSAWDFYIMYDRGCLGASAPPPSPPSAPSTPSTSSSKIYPTRPSSQNASPSSATTEKKQYKPYGANGAADEEKKPYYSPSYSGTEPEDDSTSYSEKKTHHFVWGFFIIVVLAGVGFVVHKKRRDNFNYLRFRQLREARNYAGGLNPSAEGGGGYAGVSMSDSCSFEPPTLPPTPSDNTTMI